ncbi:MAG TPA: hypothetical protein VHH88_02955 [Verrucomicrobiae bacterium]|nr:hypothetical protein [Verrucomicrobiae bacterium]
MKALLGVLIMLGVIMPAVAAVDISGNWKGTLTIGKIQLRLVVKIRKTEEGRLVAVMDSPDQGAHGLPVDKISLEGNVLHLDMNFIQGSFEGTVDTAGKRITGKWTQNGQVQPLTFERAPANEPENAENLSPSDLAASKQAARHLGGQWSGEITAGKASVPMNLNVKTNGQGAAVGTLDSPGHGLEGIPLRRFTYKDGKIHFEAPGLGAAYDGVSFNDNTSITGQWHQAEQALRLDFRKAAPAAH